MMQFVGQGSRKVKGSMTHFSRVFFTEVAGMAGRGKFYRRGTPGGWKEDLTPRQVGLVERTTASLLKRFYPDP
jgi:hypothetical protein